MPQSAEVQSSPMIAAPYLAMSGCAFRNPSARSARSGRSSERPRRRARRRAETIRTAGSAAPFAHVVAEVSVVVRGVLKELVANRVGEFVVHAGDRRKSGLVLRNSPRSRPTTLRPAFVSSLREDAAGPTDADHDRVDGFHRLRPLLVHLSRRLALSIAM